MKIYLVGDAVAGKTTFLESFHDSRFKLVPEEGHRIVPRVLEDNKFFGYLWFYLYFYHRDISIATNKIPIIERGLSEDQALVEACYQTGKINDEERRIMLYIIERMMNDLPIHSNDLAIIFTCRNEIIRRRLEERGRGQGADKDRYWDIYRTALKKAYVGKCHSWEIDTSNLSKQEMIQHVSERIMEHVGVHV